MERRKAKSDLFFLTKEILGYKDLTNSFHKELCTRINSQDNLKRLWLLPRGFFKSTIITVAHTIQLILNNPDIRILITSSTLENAKKFLVEIKNHFMLNPYLRGLFPEFCPNVPEWGTQIAVTVPNRKNFRLKEETIEVMGAEAKVVGRHYDYIKKDDLVTPETVTTQEQIDKTIDWDRYSISLFDMPQTGREDYIGTRYHDRDLYGHILDNRPDVKPYIRKAIEKGKPTFPERYGKKELDLIRIRQGSYVYSTQYQNEAISQEDATFRKDWIGYYDALPDNLRYVMAVDPAISDKPGADFSAIVVVGTDCARPPKMYVAHYIRAKLLPYRLIDKIFEMYGIYHPIETGIETVSFQKMLKFAMQDEMKHRNKYIVIKELKPTRATSKEMRIMALQPRFELGTIFIKKNHIELEDELLRFPRGRHDDLIDALSYCLEMIAPAQEKPTSAPPRMSMPWIWNKLKKWERRGEFLGNENCSEIEAWRTL
jgi:predicted phage terminase large subunit-like protein